MKTRLIAVSYILLGAVACTAPQGKKLAMSDTGLAPVATGPSSATGPSRATVAGRPLTKEANLSLAEKGDIVNLTKDGKVTVTLDSAQQDGYMWRLSEIPDPTVLKVESQNYMAPANGEGRGKEVWVFQAVGPGDVAVKMWYGNLREAPMSGNPTYDFLTAVSDQTAPEKKTKKVPKKVAPLTRA